MGKNKLKGISIFYRLLIACLLMSVFVVGVLTYISYFFSKKNLQEHAQEQALQQFRDAYNYLELKLCDEFLKDMSQLANSPVMDDYIVSGENDRKVRIKAIERLFVQYINYNRNFNNIYFINNQGMEEINVTRKGTAAEYRNFKDSKLFNNFETVGANVINITNPVKTEKDGLFFSLGFYNCGALFIDYNLGKLFEYFDEVKIFGKNALWVFDTQGEVLRQPKDETSSFSPAAHFSPQFAEDIKIIVVTQGVIIYKDFCLFPKKPVLRLAVSLPFSVLIKDLQHMVGFFAMFFLFSVIAIAVIVFFLSRYLSLPIVKLAETTAGFTKGEFLKKVDVKATGELQLLVENFNRMVDELQTTTVSKGYVDNIIKSMNDTLMVVSIDGAIKKVNNALCSLLNYTEDELVGEYVGVVFGQPGASFSDLGFEELFKMSVIAGVERSYVTKEGKKITVLFSASLVSNESGVGIEVVCVAQDISKLKNIESELREINKELDDFTYIVSHDLKEPLRSISAFSKFVIEDYSDKVEEEGKHYLKRVEANAARMQMLIEDLLEISRISRIKNPYEDVDMNMMMEDVKLRLEYTLKQRLAEIVINGSMPKVYCDKIRVTEVFVNLISNAIKFTKDKPPRIEIGYEEKAGFYEFYVKDNGPGIEEAYYEKIFKIFQRLGKREETEGTGVGLTIVKKIVEMHKGKIWVTSKVGEGTTFYFTIPKKKEFMEKKKIGEILIEKKLVTAEQLRKALEEQEEEGKGDGR